MSENPIEPRQVIDLVESYVNGELSDAQRYDNREPLDASGVYSLHQLARDVYALGVDDGSHQELWRASRQKTRDREAARGAQAAQHVTGEAAFDIQAGTLPDFLVKHTPLWYEHRCNCGMDFDPQVHEGRQWVAHVVQRMTNESTVHIPESETAE